MMTSWNGNIFHVTGPCDGNSMVTSEFHSQRPLTRSFNVSLICPWTNGGVNNRDAGDLIPHCTHYDVTIMCWKKMVWNGSRWQHQPKGRPGNYYRPCQYIFRHGFHYRQHVPLYFLKFIINVDACTNIENHVLYGMNVYISAWISNAAVGSLIYLILAVFI